MLTMFIRAVLLYLFIVLVMRGMGKRQIAQLQPYELTATMLIADLAASPMQDTGIPLLYGILPIAALVACHSLFGIITLKSAKARDIITGKPSILVKNGVVDEKELRRQGFSLTMLLEEVRADGIQNLTDVGVAILEVSGDISVFPVAQKRPLSPCDVDLKPGYEGMTLTLVADGRIFSEELRQTGKDETWLRHQLQQHNLRPEQVLLSLLDSSGRLSIQPEGTGELLYRQALQPEEVCW